MSVEREAFETAVKKRHEAAAIEKKAKTMSEDARKVILAYYADHADDFVIADPEAAATRQMKVGKLTVRVTTPTYEEKFKDDESATLLAELYGLNKDVEWELLFQHRYSFRPEEWAAFKQKYGDDVDAALSEQVDALVASHMTPSMPGSPRVEVK